MTPNSSNSRKIAIQLYTVRDELSKNLEATFQKLKEIGYSYVEIADIGERSIFEFVERLNKYSLTPISMHVDFLLLQQNPNDIFSNAKTVGINKIVVPWIDPQIWQDEAILSQVLSQLEQLGIQAEEQGVALSYHNHAHELVTSGNGYLLDNLINLAPHVSLELDIGWAYVATYQDPWDIVQRYNKRIALFHLKDVRSVNPLMFTELGNEGKILWQDLLSKIAKVNRSDWIIEQDTDFEKTSIDSAEKSLSYLSTIIL
ncbi:MAG: sugar phosphate isomerase/epimerase [Candidatus Hydrogenedens sp.]|nr:sugar phosphate isomerase/epimerase [Candidatus Hydrogenedens sp.]